MSAHRIVEIMAANWDEAGHRPPWNWRVTCSCDWQARELRGRNEAVKAWTAHRDEQTREVSA